MKKLAGSSLDSCSCIKNESVGENYSRTLFGSNVHEDYSYTALYCAEVRPDIILCS